MCRSSAILAVYLVCMSLSFGKAGAEERVLRLEKVSHHMANYLQYPGQIHNPNDDILKRVSFLVYTTEEVNSKISPIAAANDQNAKTIAELQGIVDNLRKNIKEFS